MRVLYLVLLKYDEENHRSTNNMFDLMRSEIWAGGTGFRKAYGRALCFK
jgi:hypothetical protein